MLVMAATTLLTSDQFLALPEEFDQFGNRIKDELIGGEVVKMAFPSPPHDLWMFPPPAASAIWKQNSIGG